MYRTGIKKFRGSSRREKREKFGKRLCIKMCIFPFGKYTLRLEFVFLLLFIITYFSTDSRAAHGSSRKTAVHRPFAVYECSLRIPFECFVVCRSGRVQQPGTERLPSTGQVHERVRHVPVRVPGRLQGPVDRQRATQRPDVRNMRPRPVQPPRRVFLPSRTARVQVSASALAIRKNDSIHHVRLQ